MCKVLHPVVDFIATHQFACGVAFTALVKVLPAPGTPFNFYQFVYDWLHEWLSLGKSKEKA